MAACGGQKFISKGYQARQKWKEQRRDQSCDLVSFSCVQKNCFCTHPDRQEVSKGTYGAVIRKRLRGAKGQCNKKEKNNTDLVRLIRLKQIV